MKGKDAPVTIYEPLGAHDEVPKEVLDRLKLFQQVLKFYRAQDWDKAELQLLNLQRMDSDDALLATYLDRISHLRAPIPNLPGTGFWIRTPVTGRHHARPHSRLQWRYRRQPPARRRCSSITTS